MIRFMMKRVQKRISTYKLTHYFKNFCFLYGNHKFEECVVPPSPDKEEELEECMHAYQIAGLPGCVALVDGVHIQWDSPHNFQNSTSNSNNGYLKTAVFQVACNNKRNITCY